MNTHGVFTAVGKTACITTAKARPGDCQETSTWRRAANLGSQHKHNNGVCHVVSSVSASSQSAPGCMPPVALAPPPQVAC
ncbi:hypothetical protein HaLaN_14701 [Haematococcus lacustris]|uniref:Uncharacterized protein n=1 Tax=Haematococcus lacustris TaxID=44745 RepID=A0A699Z764_HAELA|nr:hypothetical protein HaLaN_14701 [Haematococcus lacustris]